MASESVVFDRAAGFYDATRGFPPGIEHRAAAIIIQAGGISEHSRILEVGVGTGRIALPLAQHSHATLFGIDLSVLMMHRLHEKRQNERIFLTQGDITRLPYPTDAFNHVTATHVFHLIPGWKEALREVKRVLRPDGLFLSCWGDGRGEGPFEVLHQAWRTVVPPQQEKNVGVERDRMYRFAEDEGWQPVGEQLTFEYAETSTPAAFIARHEKRIYSRSWVLTDEQIAKGVAAMKAIAAQEFPDLEQNISSVRSFHVQAYQPPQV